MPLTPEVATIIAAGLGGASGAAIALCKLIWALFKLRAWRRARTEAERKSLSDINPGFALPFALVGATVLAALLGSGATMLAEARKRPVSSKCGPDCADSCKCRRGQCDCSTAPPNTTTKPRPRISAGELAAVTTYAGELRCSDGLW